MMASQPLYHFHSTESEKLNLSRKIKKEKIDGKNENKSTELQVSYVYKRKKRVNQIEVLKRIYFPIGY